ncbi:hypothetical protein RB2654_10533 [Rhodobacterales bacterium HTCC2654]|uniref:Uncharacterized protein n=2 Tax=Maritimibacter TaxID=404235 RepID=A3VF12_9RHOB|nr:hypothetical protein RB2654_10533 [Rhodobacterales bacterium HTCC2654] [Maritimibacter alkaliphilus HTCC2654]
MMQNVFERFTNQKEGNALVDWAVLFTGLALMVTSIALTLSHGPDTVSSEADVPAIVEQMAG